MTGSRKVRLAYLVTHPIQYQVPLFRQIAVQPDLSLTVFFGSDFSVRRFVDPGFDRAVAWDVPLLGGYEHETLACKAPFLASGQEPSFWRPNNESLASKLAGRFDALWVHGYHRWYHWRCILAAKALGVKVLVRDEVTGLSAQRSTAKRLAKRLFFTGFDRFVDGWLAIGALNRTYLLDQGISQDKIFTVPYAVDNDFFQSRIAQAAPNREQLRQRLGLDAGRAVILFSGKLIARKRPFDLLAAYATIVSDPAARAPYLLYAGDGELRAALQERILADRLTGAKILGFQTQSQLAALYDLCDLFVLPSEREAWGLVVNEAMNAGRAIVVSDRVGCGPDLVRSNENGFIYPCGDISALTLALRTCLSEPERLRAMGRHSRAIVDGWSYREDLAGMRLALNACLGLQAQERRE